MKKKTLNVLEGTLSFIGFWDQPIMLDTECDGPHNSGRRVDIAPIIYDFFEKNNGKSAVAVVGREIFSIKIMDSDRIIQYTREYNGNKLERFGIALAMPEPGFGWTNTRYEIESRLTELTGRKIVLELDDECLTIKLNIFDDDVPTVYMTHGNSGTLVKNYDAKDVCKPGTTDCCIFLTADKDGFSCEKFNMSMARHLLNRHTEGTMNAKRVGNCKCGGRWEELRKIIKEHNS